MPAPPMHAADARTRNLRLIAVGVALLFLATTGATRSGPVEAKDWTPQIQTTRRAQVYWETIMRGADAELRALKKTKRQAKRKFKKIESNLEVAVDRRAAAKRRLKDAKATLSDARDQLETVTTPTLPPPDADTALEILVAPSPLAVAALTVTQAAIELYPITTAASEPEPTRTVGRIDDRVLAKSAKQVKKAKRDLRKAGRKAKRAARNARSAKARTRSIKAAESGAFARRESAERSLGTWILAMTKYGRIRATKKSEARPGVNSSFTWPVAGRISQYYHPGHDGLDIVRYQGAPVRSMAFGVVTYVGWNPWDQHGRAFMVVVTHAGGYETLYGHLLPKRIVRVGQELKKGEVVGYMGSTGNSTGPHLHLELRRGRTTINPLGFL